MPIHWGCGALSHDLEEVIHSSVRSGIVLKCGPFSRTHTLR